MDSALFIGTKVDKASTEAIGQLVDKIFTSAAKNRMDQETVRVALTIVEKGISINGTNITNCTIVGEKTVS